MQTVKKQPAKLPSEVILWSKSGVKMTHQGGYTINNPQMLNVFVGNWDSGSNTERIERINQFTADLLGSNYMSLLVQYGCTTPGSFIGSAKITSVPSKNLNDLAVQGLLQQAISNNIIPEPKKNTVYILYFDNTIGFTDNSININMCSPTASDTAFGYHHFFVTQKSNKCYYGVIPPLTDYCLQNTCFSSLNCSLKNAQTQEERITQVASHEIAEIISDPESNAWFDTLSGRENADICNGFRASISNSGRSWNVQQIYSHMDDKRTNGNIVCAASSSATDQIPQGILASIGFPQVDWDNKYNLIGGAIFCAGAVFYSTYKGGGIVSLISIGSIGMLIGILAVDRGKNYLSTEQKNVLKNQVLRLGNMY